MPQGSLSCASAIHLVAGSYCEASQRRDDGCCAQAVCLRVVRSPLTLRVSRRDTRGPVSAQRMLGRRSKNHCS